MTVLTVGVVAVICTAGAAAPVVAAGAAATTTGAAAGAGAGAAVGTVLTAAGTAASTGAAVAGSAGAGAAAGAMAGAAVGGTVGGAATGAAVGGAAGAAVTSTSAGAAGLIGGIATGPVGWLILGTSTSMEENPSSGKSTLYTFDCWKPVLRETSCEPSNGILLRDIVNDPRIRSVTTTEPTCEEDCLPEIILENIWGETFHIEYIMLPCSKLSAHAVLIV